MAFSLCLHDKSYSQQRSACGWLIFWWFCISRRCLIGKACYVLWIIGFNQNVYLNQIGLGISAFCSLYILFILSISWCTLVSRRRFSFQLPLQFTSPSLSAKTSRVRTGEQGKVRRDNQQDTCWQLYPGFHGHNNLWSLATVSMVAPWIEVGPKLNIGRAWV